MASPFKRIYCQAARQSVRQRQPLRPFTTTTTHRRADHVNPDTSSDNPFLTSFPQADSSAQDNPDADPEFEQDDLSSLALSELDQHRELRDMIRSAAWEMPLLASLHKPFEPPRRRRLPLQWRYTTYMGETHPAQSKVVVTFDPRDLRHVSDASRDKLRKLAGTRYDHTKNQVKMSCESFETQAENKRYLGDVIASLISEAKDPNTDSFLDIPLDTRHVKRKPKLRFPTAWLLTPERKAELEEARRVQLLEDGRKVENDEMVSGEAAIEAARQLNLQKVEAPMMAEARQPLPRGKMGRKEMGQTRGAQR
ncbi:37S ribosomal protein S24, mitochondrial [Teratosphaeriaceae sp. CCFEE 6253]|nr:37S ribosomal protein S24, mitochondrial [Teratosphaeriaceae sp. CCFEE 6253]